MTEAMKTAVRAMYAMNKQVDAQALQRIMMEFDKQTEFMEMKQELMNDTIDSAMQSEGDEAMEDQLINQVLDEVGIQSIEALEQSALPSVHHYSGLDKDMKDRMEKLRK